MFNRLSRISGSFAALILLAQPAHSQLSQAAAQNIVDIYANDAVASGSAVGVGVGVVKGGVVVINSGYGYANFADQTPFQSNTIAEIASLTKLFTTNLLGQDVVNKRLSLTTTLGQLSAQIGATQPLTSQVTLEELGDFTAGFPNEAPVCSFRDVPGCLPDPYVGIPYYSIADFLDYFQNAVPANQNVTPAQPITSLPAPFFYSDFSVGLLGLILGNPGAPIESKALSVWYQAIDRAILTPLGMSSTYLSMLSSVPASRFAAGYSLATATATVSDGHISAIDLTDPGLGYASAPAVTISGGGGSGATAVAQIKSDRKLTRIVVASKGANYVAPPSIVLSGGGVTTQTVLRAIIQNGQIVGFQNVTHTGGYRSAPTVTITGGRAASGADAQATARIGGGQVTELVVTSGGSGYYPELRVNVAPGNAEYNPTPAWGAAASLLSTVDDMNSFDSAALGAATIGEISVPPALTAGFEVSETPYACYGPNPSLATCPPGQALSALAWKINPADTVNGLPLMLIKNGGLTGFSSQIMLMPSDNLAVYVIVNSDDGAPARGLATQIIESLYYAGE